MKIHTYSYPSNVGFSLVCAKDQDSALEMLAEVDKRTSAGETVTVGDLTWVSSEEYVEPEKTITLTLFELTYRLQLAWEDGHAIGDSRVGDDWARGSTDYDWDESDTKTICDNIQETGKIDEHA